MHKLILVECLRCLLLSSYFEVEEPTTQITRTARDVLKSITSNIFNFVSLYSSSFRHSLFEPSASVEGTYKCELNKDLHNNNSLLDYLDS